MINELLRRLLYTAGIQLVIRATGIRLHPKAEYRLLYLQSAWWHLLRTARRWRDGSRCVDCGKTSWLETDHESYQNKGTLLEFFDLRTRCRTCHRRKSQDRGQL